jgi:hypothetical protein
VACNSCKSNRVPNVSGKMSDMCSVNLNGKYKNGYVPSDFNIGGGDYIDFAFCLDCGKIQGNFPLPLTSLEKPEEIDE